MLDNRKLIRKLTKTFPELRESDLARFAEDPMVLTRYLALQNELTFGEALEQLDLFGIDLFERRLNAA